MGTTQSSTFASDSSTHDNTKETKYNMKTCYYELLGVERTASDAELKKAYRKQALIWHPDKNYDRVDEATQTFALIQHAYEVLSDPHERAWYDGHRDEILREDSDYAGDTDTRGYSTLSGHTPESLMRFFSPDCYMGFNDDGKGFYAVYRELFAQLAKEETEAHNPDFEETDHTVARLDWLSSCSFGDSHTPFVDESRPERSMKVFYNEWSNFATRKSFRWLDKWRLSDAPNRFVKRHMEKENKKNRETGRRAYNDAVRNLVSFVRKRDPRYKQFQQDQEVLRKEREEAQKAKLAAERAERLQRLEDYEAPAWAKIEEHDAVLDELDDVWEEEEIQWECQACNKRFKNERQWKNHESSKKHHEMVEILRRELLAEDGIEEEEEASSDASTTNLTESETEELNDETKAQVDPDDEEQEEQEEQEEPEEEEEEEEEVVTFSIKSKKAQKKAAAKRRAGRGATWSTEANLLADDTLSPEELADLLASSQINSNTKKTNSLRDDDNVDDALNEDMQDSSDEHAADSSSQWNTSASQKRERKSGRGRRRAKSGRNVESTLETASLADGDQVNRTDNHTMAIESDDDEDGKAPGSSKKKANRRGATGLPNTNTSQFTCAVCNAKFETRNAMFKHIAATGHAIPLSVKNSGTQTKKNNKKKKGSRT